jgi:putative metal-binding protein
LRRSTLLALPVVAGLALAGGRAAQAHEFKPAWGYAFIDDAPFNDPAAGGALLPSTRVFPRGYIRDTTVDGRDVRLSVFVFRAGNASSQKSFSVDEGDFKNVSFDQVVDISPFAVTYLAYDFCRFNPSNGVVEVCETRHRIGRPAEPTPTPTPTATATATPRGGTPQPSPTDADADGVPVPADCWDTNATVFPGAREIPGNSVDDDCSGGDAPGRLTATIKSKWVTAGRRVQLDTLRVLEAPEGALVEVTCQGAHCPFKRRSRSVDAKGNAPLMKFFKHRRLRPRITIDVRVTYPNWIGRVGRFTLKRVDVPNMQRLCLPPGITKPQRC